MNNFTRQNNSFLHYHSFIIKVIVYKLAMMAIEQLHIKQLTDSTGSDYVN